MSTGTLRLKKLQHTNGTDIASLDSSGAMNLSTIKSSTGNTAITISSSGIVNQAMKPAFRVKTNNSSHFGQNHGSTTYDTNYLTPLPVFPDGNTTTELNVGGGTLTFETHPAGNGGKYLKYVVPVTGVYIFSIAGSLRVQQADDFVCTGFSKNTASEAGTGFMEHVCNGYQAYQADVHMPLGGLAVIDCTAGDYIVPYAASTHQAYIDNSLGIKVFGYLLK